MLNARMWHAAGGRVYGWEWVEYETMNWKGDEITKKKQGAVDVGDQDPTGAGRVQVHTCVVTFPDGTAASVIVNSPLGGPDPQCVVLRKAWAAAL